MTTLVAGSYERFLFAYDIKEAYKDEDQARPLCAACSCLTALEQQAAAN